MYDAERRAERRIRALLKSGPDMRTQDLGLATLADEEIQPFVDEVCDRLGVRRVLADLIPEKTRAASYHHSRKLIKLPPWARNRITILHELAHHTTHRAFPSHGAEFVENFMLLVRAFLPEATAQIFTEEFLAAGVELRPTGKQGKRFLAYALKLTKRNEAKKPVVVVTNQPRRYRGYLLDYDRNGAVVLGGVDHVTRKTPTSKIPTSAVRYATWDDGES